MLKINHVFKISLASVILIIGACKKEYDTPPSRTIPVGNVLNIQELKDIYVNQNVRINGDSSVYAVVTMDERSGNLYRNVYIEDATGAINLRLKTSGSLYEGDSIRIYLKGTTISKFNGMFQLDSVDTDLNIIKQGVGRFVTPLDIDITQINSSLQARLVRVNNVQFNNTDQNQPYADAINQATINRTIEDCNGNSTIVRTSGYAGFAADRTPTGRGSIIAIIGEFNGTMQLYVRRPSEVIMNGERCGGGGGGAIDVLQENFNGASDNTNFSAFGWTNFATAGSRVWRGRIFNEDKYLQANSFQSTDPTSESWLITPEMIFSPTKKLSFKSAVAFYTHNALSVWISSNYITGANPTSANWIPITATLAGQSSGNYNWINSGTIELAGYLPQGYEGNFHVAFRYNGSGPNNQTGTSTVDDIFITN